MSSLAELVVVSLTAVHLVAVGVAAAGPLVALAFVVLERRTARASMRAAGLLLLHASLATLVFGVLLGTAALAALWLDREHAWFAAAARVPPSRYWFAIPEALLFIVFVAAMHVIWRRAAVPLSRGRAIGLWVLGLAAGTNLMYHFPMLFAVIAVESSQSHAASERINFHRALLEPETLARAAHFVLASIALTGVVLLLDAWRRGRAETPADQQPASLAAATWTWQLQAVWGARLVLAPTLLQWIVGTWLLAELPAVSREQIFGGDLAATIAFVGSLGTTVMMMHRLATLSLGEVSRRAIATVVGLMLLTILLMCAARHRARLPLYDLQARTANCPLDRG